MSDSDYTPIRVSTIRGDLKIPFDAYVRIGGKYIHYLRKGESFEGKRLSKLKEKKLKSMYISVHDDKQYRTYLTENVDRAYDVNPSRPIETRVEVIQGVQQAAAEDMMEQPDVKEFYNVAKHGSQRYADFILKEKDATRAILQMENIDGSISQHGVSVATIALTMAEKLGLSTSHPMNLLVMGSLIHDIEHFHSNLPITQPINLLSPEQLEIYKQHPQEGTLRLQKCGFYDQMVMNIILQHEEYMDGSGYPKKLKEKELDPMSMLVGAANSFDRLVTFEKVPIKDAIKKLLIEKLGLHSLDHLKALQEALRERKLF